MGDPTFSIVTPVRNGFPQLRRCVGSVRGQIGLDKEHLVQDAASTDGSVPWLRTQQDISTVSEPDMGMYDAINRGWSRSSGSILSWLNSDEQYLPGSLERVADLFAERPDLDVVFGDALLVDSGGALIAARREIPLRRAYVRGTFLYALSCTTFFRRSLLDEGALTFNPKRRVVGDAELILALLKEGRKFSHIPQYLGLFGIDGANLSLHPAAKAESDEVSGRGSGPLLGILASSGRRVEKALRGCYRRQSVEYDWAEDEQPHYRQFHYGQAQTRFEWQSATTSSNGSGR